jgi:hypothetical protein
MKKLFLHINNYLLLALLATVALVQPGCKKDSSPSTGTPVITSVRNYVAHPGDSLLTSVGTGQWVVISGKNLKGALQINFDGVKGSFNDAWFSDTSAIVLIPAVIAFPMVPAKQLNTIQYVTTHGQTTFSFSIVPPAPTISGISNEDANPGDSVKINGFNFFFIKSVTYAGVNITDYTGSNDGTSISLAVPASVTQTGGIVSVTTKSGSVSTLYNVSDFSTGVLNNYDNVNNFSWGSGTSNSSSAYPGNNGYYGLLNGTAVPANDDSWWNYGRSINLNAATWVPTANMSDPISDYALKFEINVNVPWAAGSINVIKDYSFNTYMAVYRPWKKASGATVPFTTNGWQTVVIPLTSFRTNNGTGVQPSSLNDLLGSGSGSLNMLFNNDSPTVIPNYEIAVDNIRIIKISN